MRLRAVAMTLLAAALLATAAAPAGAAAPQASQAEIEGEVMCPVCGTLLELAEAPQALREKAFIKRLIAEGQTKAEIKQALVAEYGDAVLALPEGKGFRLSAYVVPIVAFLVALAALVVGVLRWRRAGGRRPPDAPAGKGPSREQSDRLDADLARYDL